MHLCLTPRCLLLALVHTVTGQGETHTVCPEPPAPVHTHTRYTLLWPPTRISQWMVHMAGLLGNKYFFFFFCDIQLG